MDHPPRPFSKRKTIQLMVILTILAWATQTLFHQWGYGATIEIRQTAAVAGSTVTLKDIACWSRADAQAASAWSDIIVATVATPELSKNITADQIKSALHDAGIGLANVHLSGAATCVVSRDLSPLPVIRERARVRVISPTPVPPSFTVHPGDSLTVTFDLSNSTVQTVLQALDQGSPNSTIRAKNEATGSVHSVTLTAPGEARCLPSVAAVR